MGFLMVPSSFGISDFVFLSLSYMYMLLILLSAFFFLPTTTVNGLA